MGMSLFNGCGGEGTVSMRIPYSLFVDMLVNCPKTDERDELVEKLVRLRKAHDLEVLLKKKKVFEKLLDNHT